MKCKSCGSDNTQRLVVAYQNGTRIINTRSNSVGVGVGFGGLGVGSATTTTTGTSTSLLATRAAPPSKKRYWVAFIIPVALWFAEMSLKGPVATPILNISAYAILAFFLFRIYQYNSTKWPQLYRHWQSLWICQKCGSIYSQE